MKVKLHYGDWENHYAHIYWAYITDTFEKGVIPHHMYTPNVRIEYTDNKHDEYKYKPNKNPITVCEEWCKEKDHEIVERKKLGDD